jgi:Tol biopolymer transport system component
LLYLRTGELWSLDFTDHATRLFMQPAAGAITHIAPAPDDSRIAYAVEVKDQNLRVIQSDIYVADRDGASARVVVHEQDEGFRLGSISWPQDPNRLVYAKEHPSRGIERVEEVDLVTGARSLILEGASSPFASSTTPQLAYATPVGNGWSLWSYDRELDRRAEIVRSAWFDDADNPTFSPDGSRIAFVAAGTGPAREPTRQEIFFDFRLLSTASAHNLLATFFDLWIVNSDGTGLRRVAHLLDFQPEFAWSPGGRQIAAMGTLQLQIVDVETGNASSVPRPAGRGKVTWRP